MAPENARGIQMIKRETFLSRPLKRSWDFWCARCKQLFAPVEPTHRIVTIIGSMQRRLWNVRQNLGKDPTRVRKAPSSGIARLRLPYSSFPQKPGSVE